MSVRINKARNAFTVIFALFGMVLIFDPLHIKADGFSMFLAVSSGISWAISAIVSKKLHHRAPELDLLNITAWQTLLGCIPIIIVALLLPAPPIKWTLTFNLTLIYSMFLSGSLAWVLWAYALQRLPAGSASMATMLAPIIGVLTAWLQLGEVPTTIELIGMVFVALALVIISAITIKKHQAIDIAEGQE